MTVESVSTDIDAMSPTYGQEFVVEEEVVNPNMFHHIPLEDMMIVQPTGDHLIGHDSKGEEAVKGSQLTNIMPADLPEGFEITSMDYIKLGPYIEALGGLKSPTTNQALYRIDSDGNMSRMYIR